MENLSILNYTLLKTVFQLKLTKNNIDKIDIIDKKKLRDPFDLKLDETQNDGKTFNQINSIYRIRITY